MKLLRTVGQLKEEIANLPDDMQIVRVPHAALAFAHFVDGNFDTWCYSRDGNICNCCSHPNYPHKDVRQQVLNLS